MWLFESPKHKLLAWAGSLTCCRVLFTLKWLLQLLHYLHEKLCWDPNTDNDVEGLDASCPGQTGVGGSLSYSDQHGTLLGFYSPPPHLTFETRIKTPQQCRLSAWAWLVGFHSSRHTAIYGATVPTIMSIPDIRLCQDVVCTESCECTNLTETGPTMKTENFNSCKKFPTLQ